MYTLNNTFLILTILIIPLLLNKILKIIPLLLNKILKIILFFQQQDVYYHILIGFASTFFIF